MKTCYEFTSATINKVTDVVNALGEAVVRLLPKDIDSAVVFELGKEVQRRNQEVYDILRKEQQESLSFAAEYRKSAEVDYGLGQAFDPD